MAFEHIPFFAVYASEGQKKRRDYGTRIALGAYAELQDTLAVILHDLSDATDYGLCRLPEDHLRDLLKRDAPLRVLAFIGELGDCTEEGMAATMSDLSKMVDALNKPPILVVLVSCFEAADIKRSEWWDITKNKVVLKDVDPKDFNEFLSAELKTMKR